MQNIKIPFLLICFHDNSLNNKYQFCENLIVNLIFTLKYFTPSELQPAGVSGFQGKFKK